MAETFSRAYPVKSLGVIQETREALIAFLCKQGFNNIRTYDDFCSFARVLKDKGYPIIDPPFTLPELVKALDKQGYKDIPTAIVEALEEEDIDLEWASLRPKTRLDAELEGLFAEARTNPEASIFKRTRASADKQVELLERLDYFTPPQRVEIAEALIWPSNPAYNNKGEHIDYAQGLIEVLDLLIREDSEAIKKGDLVGLLLEKHEKEGRRIFGIADDDDMAEDSSDERLEHDASVVAASKK